MTILTIDVGGNHVKMRTSDRVEALRFDSGPTMTPADMVATMRPMIEDWEFDAITIGYPGVVSRNRIVKEPKNLGAGWTTFDFAQAFRKPIRFINDAAMQALGSYEGGTMLFLGLGTGLGSAMILEDLIQPLELAHLPYRKRKSYEDYLGDAGYDRLGEEKWTKHVWRVVELFRDALQPEYVVIGGGNVHRLTTFPDGVRRGDSEHAFTGGFRLWEPPYAPPGGLAP